MDAVNASTDMSRRALFLALREVLHQFFDVLLLRVCGPEFSKPESSIFNPVWIFTKEKSLMNKSLEGFFKKLNGSAIFSEPQERLTDKKIEKICHRIKLRPNQTIKKLLK